MSQYFRPKLVIRGGYVDRAEEVLSVDALEFVIALDARFAQARVDLLEARSERRRRIATGAEHLGFLDETRHIRQDATWRVAEAAPGLVRRHVEITGPPLPTMAVNALNSGADVWMADFEDATTPTWRNVIEGQLVLLDALDDTLDFTGENGKRYRVDSDPATLVVRPRGWHLVDKHVVIDGRPVSASLMDFGLHFFHGARRQLRNGHVPAFYLPKLESHLEARLWNDVFNFAQDYIGIARGTIRATVLIETLPAAFEMEEILYELRDHCAGLNAGRWDYIFSTIKYLGTDPSFVLPDRSAVTMAAPFMKAYTQLLVDTCHRRGAHAIGGMAAAVPVKSDPAAFDRAMELVRADKEREARGGFDGSWVAHPASVPICRDAFETVLGARDSQKDVVRGTSVTASDLLAVGSTPGAVTEAGIRSNLRTAMRYLAAWLDGLGAVALDGLMEDAATVEIARSQLWQWRVHGTEFVSASGQKGQVTAELLRGMLDEERRRIAAESRAEESLSQERAATLLRELIETDPIEPFFTTIAYARWVVETKEPVAA